MALSDSEEGSGRGGGYKETKCRLPSWTMQGGRVNISMEGVIDAGLLVIFAMDKVGCQ
jgi:hypothetical protein